MHYCHASQISIGAYRIKAHFCFPLMKKFSFFTNEVKDEMRDGSLGLSRKVNG